MVTNSPQDVNGEKMNKCNRNKATYLLSVSKRDVFFSGTLINDSLMSPRSITRTRMMALATTEAAAADMKAAGGTWRNRLSYVAGNNKE